MLAQGLGKIVNIASLLSFQGGIRVASYTAAKSGVAGVTKLLANEWAAHGINVNAIAPGYIATDNTAALRADETRNRQILERIPAGRWGSSRRHRRRRGVPRLVRVGLRQRPYPRRRRRLAGALMGRVVCFGELLLRLAAPGRELLLQTGRLDVHVAGAEANVAVALARLGHEVAMVTRLPDNPLGEAAIGHLRRWGVDTSGVSTGPGRMGLYFLSPGAGLRASSIIYDREGSAFALSKPENYDWTALLEGVDLLHISGITPALGPHGTALVEAAAQAARVAGVRIAVDGNYRGNLWRRWDGDARAILSGLVGKAAILFGNHRDISLLLGEEFDGEGEDRRRAAAEAAFEAFPSLELIASTARHVTDADTHRLSARIDSRERSVQTDEIVVAGIVDRIGSGDAFAAGVLHGLRTGRDLDWTARAGLALACLKHSLPGDVSLFGPADIESFLAGELDVRR